MINIIYEDNHLLVVEKPVNIPVQLDSSNDKDLLTELKGYLVKKYNKPNDAYLGLVHRLDRPVGGVMVFAKTSKAASRLSKQISEHSFKKTYLAITTNKLNKENGTYEDYLLKNHKTNTVSVVNKHNKNGKKAILSYDLLQQYESLSLVKIDLKTGRSHQIRVQFSSRGYPLWGDQRYNSTSVNGQQIALWAYSLTLVHPTTKEEMTFVSPPPNIKPWKEFEI